jgi:hypothetical protein
MRLNKLSFYPRPPVRPLKIYAFDPMDGRDSITRISVDTRNEPLTSGPLGARIAIIDYDSHHRCFYTPVDLDDPAVLMQGGIDHAEGDPRFHQQMVYAVASRILELFDRALGRPVDLGGSSPNGQPRPLRLFPHAFAQANAFYDRNMGAILFGYFKAGEEDSGANIPGQLIFTCLSHDIIAHELTHALIDRLGPGLLLVDNPDSFALHEGLSDLVPMLHRFTLSSVLREQVRLTRGRIEKSQQLVKIAGQLGAALGKTHGLRDASLEPSANQYLTVMEPHERGSLLMSAVFEALFETYHKRVYDLFQIAGPRNHHEELHPDLVNRISEEASRTALSMLAMCIRAFDYLPPVDVTLGDLLRAMVTADKELIPADPFGQRAAMIEAFRRRGIYASGARSLAEESLVWERPAHPIAPLPATIVSALTRTAQAFRRIRPEEGEQVSPNELDNAARSALVRFARDNAKTLQLLPERKIQITGLRHNFRVAPDGQLVVEIIVQIVQRFSKSQYRGVTIVGAADGTIRYIIPNQPRPKFPTEEAQREPEAAAATVGAAAPAALRAAEEDTDSQGVPHPFPLQHRMSPSTYRKLYPQLSRLVSDRARLNEIYEY